MIIAKKEGGSRKLLALAVTVTMEGKNQPIEMWGMSIWEIVEFFGKEMWFLDLRCRDNYKVKVAVRQCWNKIEGVNLNNEICGEDEKNAIN